MLEHYFHRPVTADRVRALWLGPQIERYVGWLEARRASSASVLRHVSTLRHFNQFVCARGVTAFEQLPAHVQPFVDEWMRAKAPSRLSKAARGAVLANAQVQVEQLLELIVPGFARVRHRVATPFMASVPGFFPFLREERGLRPETCAGRAVELRKFEAFLQRSDVGLSDLSPSLLGRYIAERAKWGICIRTTVRRYLWCRHPAAAVHLLMCPVRRRRRLAGQESDPPTALCRSLDNVVYGCRQCVIYRCNR